VGIGRRRPEPICCRRRSPVIVAHGAPLGFRPADTADAVFILRGCSAWAFLFIGYSWICLAAELIVYLNVRWPNLAKPPHRPPGVPLFVNLSRPSGWETYDEIGYSMSS